MGKEEMKNKISMALKDPVLQIGFEIICKNLSELESENAELKEKLNFSTQYYQGERAKENLAKAKEIISKLIALSRKEWVYADVREEAEAFLEELEE